jgi:hypothetical protein
VVSLDLHERTTQVPELIVVSPPLPTIFRPGVAGEMLSAEAPPAAIAAKASEANRARPKA